MWKHWHFSPLHLFGFDRSNELLRFGRYCKPSKYLYHSATRLFYVFTGVCLQRRSGQIWRPFNSTTLTPERMYVLESTYLVKSKTFYLKSLQLYTAPLPINLHSSTSHLSVGYFIQLSITTTTFSITTTTIRIFHNNNNFRNETGFQKSGLISKTIINLPRTHKINSSQ